LTAARPRSHSTTRRRPDGPTRQSYTRTCVTPLSADGWTRATSLALAHLAAYGGSPPGKSGCTPPIARSLPSTPCAIKCSSCDQILPFSHPLAPTSVNSTTNHRRVRLKRSLPPLKLLCADVPSPARGRVGAPSGQAGRPRIGGNFSPEWISPLGISHRDHHPPNLDSRYDAPLSVYLYLHFTLR
jgi:hypothetical protein